MWAYKKSTLFRYTEEAIAQAYATRSIWQGLRFPRKANYRVTPVRLIGESVGLAAALGGLWTSSYLGSDAISHHVFSPSDE